METKETATQKHELEYPYGNNAYSFRRGIEFAQRWIPVEEELPVRKDHGFSDRVLTKDRLDNFKIERYDYEFNHFNDIRYDSIVDGDGQVTHWRPIEFK